MFGSQYLFIDFGRQGDWTAGAYTGLEKLVRYCAFTGAVFKIEEIHSLDGSSIWVLQIERDGLREHGALGMSYGPDRTDILKALTEGAEWLMHQYAWELWLKVSRVRLPWPEDYVEVSRRLMESTPGFVPPQLMNLGGI